MQSIFENSVLEYQTFFLLDQIYCHFSIYFNLDWIWYQMIVISLYHWKFWTNAILIYKICLWKKFKWFVDKNVFYWDTIHFNLNHIYLFYHASNIEKLYLSDWKFWRKYIMWMWIMCLGKGRSKYPCTSNHLSSFAIVADSRSFLFTIDVLIIKRFIE